MFVEILLVTTLICFNPEVHCKKSKEILHQKKFPLCKACKVFVESFKKGMDQTAKGKFEGGDTAWEEQNLGSYANSEVRLTEIQENICGDVEEGKDQCYSIHEEHDSILEEWWFHKRRNEHDLFEFFCIEKLKYCCPHYHYGENCTPCDGYPDYICSNNGKCNGAGTRKGNGKCICEAGYAGDKCDQCSNGYFETFENETKIICSQCHSSCDESCTKAGPEGCTKCKKGWLLDGNNGCIDVNECDLPVSLCDDQQFCVNNEGSYSCQQCAPFCKFCTVDGCRECADGFIMKNNQCTNDRVDMFIHFARTNIMYVVAILGLVAVFKKSPPAAACIITVVAIYVQISRWLYIDYATPDDKKLTESNS